MSEVNTDLPKNDETGLEEKIDFADDTENEKKSLKINFYQNIFCSDMVYFKTNFKNALN